MAQTEPSKKPTFQRFNLSVGSLPIKTPLRLPRAYLRYYGLFNKCECCGSKLRHELHAYNHYMKYHNKVRFYIWAKYLQRWVEVDKWQFVYSKERKIPTAVSKY
jgi:hypothetical protein